MEDILNRLRAVAEHTRLRLLYVLSGNELTVSEITTVLDQSQPRVSRHLKILCEAGILDRKQEGASVFYRLADQGSTAQFTQTLLTFVPEDDPQLQRDLARLEDIKQQHVQAALQYFKDNAQRWGRIRALYLADPAVEDAMLEAAGSGTIDNLLDVGTGTGSMLEVFGSRIRRGLGIDSSRDMLAVARANLEASNLSHCQVRKGDIYNLPVDTATMDVVTIHHVLHFLDDPGLAIAEATRTLKPGGRLIIVDFARHDMEFLRSEFAHRRLGFDDEEVIKWCQAVGLSEVSVQSLTSAKSTPEARPRAKLWLGVRRKDVALGDNMAVA